MLNNWLKSAIAAAILYGISYVMVRKATTTHQQGEQFALGALSALVFVTIIYSRNVVDLSRMSWKSFVIGFSAAMISSFGYYLTSQSFNLLPAGMNSSMVVVIISSAVLVSAIVDNILGSRLELRQWLCILIAILAIAGAVTDKDNLNKLLAYLER